jgi:hypothetical protein
LTLSTGNHWYFRKYWLIGIDILEIHVNPTKKLSEHTFLQKVCEMHSSPNIICFFPVFLYSPCYAHEIILITCPSNRLLCPLARLMSSRANLPDEYGKLDCSGDTYVSKKFVLECGAILEEAHVRPLLYYIILYYIIYRCVYYYYFLFQVRYNTFGVLNSERDNVLVVCHALTGNSRLDQWWGPLLGMFPFDKFLYIYMKRVGF